MKEAGKHISQETDTQWLVRVSTMKKGKLIENDKDTILCRESGKTSLRK